MKKAIALLVAFALMAPALSGNSAEAAGSAAGGVDTARSFYQYYAYVQAAVTEDTMYFKTGNSDFVQFVDKATGITGPLCGRPECGHNSKDCDAWVGQTARMFIDGGRLYAVSMFPESGWGGYPVYSMALDGKDHRTEGYLDSEMLPGFGETPYYLLHNGVLYYGNLDHFIENGEEKFYNHICAFPLGGKTEPYDILWEEVPITWDFSMQFYGDGLYFITNELAADTEDRYDFRLRRYDVRTGEIETLYEDLSSPPGKATEFWVTDGGVYFDRRTNDPLEVKIYFYDFETGTCAYQFSTGVEWSRMGIADDLVTGLNVTARDNGVRDLLVVLKDFDGNELVNETYSFDFGFLELEDGGLDYSAWETFFLGRDETQAYYAFNGERTSIIAVALDGSGARVLCTEAGQ